MLVKKFDVVGGNRCFSTVFTKAQSCTHIRSWTDSLQSPRVSYCLIIYTYILKSVAFLQFFRTNLYVFPISSTCAARYVHLILRDLITKVIFKKSIFYR